MHAKNPASGSMKPRLAQMINESTLQLLEEQQQSEKHLLLFFLEVQETRITSKANTIKMAIQYPLRLELDKGKSRGT